MDRSVEIDGLKIRMVERGKGDPVILLHGLGGSIESWINNVRSLSSEARVVCLDLLGFGQSDKPQVSYTISFYRDFLIKFMISGIGKGVNDWLAEITMTVFDN